MAYCPHQITRVLFPAAQRRETVTYAELGEALGKSGPMAARGLGGALVKCQDWLKNRGLPPLTSLVVQKATGKPSPDGTLFGRTFSEMSDDEIDAMQQECFDYQWTDEQLRDLRLG